MDHFALAYCLRRSLQPIKARKVRRESVTGHANHDKVQREPPQVDLMFKFAVNGHEDVELAFGKAEASCLYYFANLLRSRSKRNGQEMRHARRREHIRLGGYAREQRFFG
jgi:hypothetical protein